jgi:hypothetical protein
MYQIILDVRDALIDLKSEQLLDSWSAIALAVDLADRMGYHQLWGTKNAILEQLRLKGQVMVAVDQSNDNLIMIYCQPVVE